MIVRRCFVAIAALRDAAAKSALHGSHPRKEVGRAGRPEEGTFSGPTRILGVLYRESFFAGEGMILEASCVIRVHVTRSFWLRSRSVRRQRSITWCRNTFSARALVGVNFLGCTFICGKTTQG